VSSSYAATAGSTAGAADSTKALRTLYYVRFGFAIVWAVLMMAIAKKINPGATALLVIYPLFDVAAAVIDFRTSGTTRPKAPLYVNMALSLLTAIGLAVATSNSG
jgi:hypothetical protein